MPRPVSRNAKEFLKTLMPAIGLMKLHNKSSLSGQTVWHSRE